MSDANRIVQAAQFLLEEHRTRKPFGPIPAPCAARTVDEAYAVQEAFHALMAATHGPVAGYKIALTTPVMQHMVGFHEPVSGAILAKTMQQSPCTIRSTDYGRLGVECEIAVRLEADLPVTPAPYSRDQITAAIGAVMAAFELIDDRNADYAQFAPQILSIVADNAWNGGIVLCSPATDWRALDPAAGPGTNGLQQGACWGGGWPGVIG